MRQKPNIHRPMAEALPYDFFIGGESKTSDFTIYYNIALENLTTVLKENTNPSRRDAFLAEYFWKAHLLRRNADGYTLTTADREIIASLIKKVEEIRNYHSHLWHDNAVLKFEPVLRDFVERKYQEAKAALFVEYPGAVTDYEALQNKRGNKGLELFKKVSGHYFITAEGRAFFLSFFLTTGQMAQFLQQRKGSKRADMPLFKVKRLLYTYYCHRDGSSIMGFNHEDRFIYSMKQEEIKEIFKARTGYKLMSYLIDFPDYWASTEAMPLFDRDGNLIKNVEQLVGHIEDNGILPGFNFTFIAAGKRNIDELEKKEQELKYRTGSVAFTHQDVPAYSFNITFNSLHRLVLLTYLDHLKEDVNNTINALTSNLLKLSEIRSELYRILTIPAAKRTEQEQLFLLNKEMQFLRGSRRLTEKGIIFFELLEKDRTEKADDAISLANHIRPMDKKSIQTKGFKDDCESEPEAIQVYIQDFIAGANQKFRAGNRFLFYATKYLMDFAGDGNWYWGVEKFEQDTTSVKDGPLLKRKAYLKASEIFVKDEYRLSTDNNHIYLATLKNEDGKSNHERFHQFAIGPKAMRYLTAYIKDNEAGYKTQMASFFELLSDDLQKLHKAGYWNDNESFNLLEKPFVSSYLKPAGSDLAILKNKVKMRVKFIEEQWASAMANIRYLSRAEKNRMVMDGYRLFDWASDRSDGKFLRANEFNQMSVCHYSLHLSKEEVHPSIESSQYRGRPYKKSKFDYLYENLFGFSERQPSIPKEIKKMLSAAESLDDLLLLVIKDRKKFLDDFLVKLDSLPPQLQKKELKVFCPLIGISIPAHLLKTLEVDALKEKHRHTSEVQLFAIHAMLIVKHFFPQEYNAGKKMEVARDKAGLEIKVRPQLDILSSVRKNKALNKVLVPNFYENGIADRLYPDPAREKQRHTLTGLINTTYTEDIILWWIAQRYLKNDHTGPVATFLTSRENTTINKVQLKGMLDTDILLPLKREGEDDPISEQLYTTVKMHQLDDLMFLTEKSRLRKAAVHFMKRCIDEKEHWRLQIEQLGLKQFNGGALPDCSIQHPIPFQLLRDEIHLVNRHGKLLADYLLKFEKKILTEFLDTRFKGDKHAFQEWLTANIKGDDVDTSSERRNETFDHLNFKGILKVADELGYKVLDIEDLDNYRNITFHNDIPISSGSFSWFTRSGQALRAVLGIDRDLNASKDRSEYLPVE